MESADNMKCFYKRRNGGDVEGHRQSKLGGSYEVFSASHLQEKGLRQSCVLVRVQETIDGNYSWGLD